MRGEWLWFVTSALAVYRLTRLVTDDVISEPLRERVKRLGEPWDYGIECAWCVSIWVALAVVVFWWLAPGVWHVASVILALSAVSGFLASHE